MKNNYTLIIRTGDAEIKAIENISEVILDKIFPVIEITRGRKKTIDKDTKDESISFPFDSRLKKFKDVFKNKTVGITLTNEDLLKSEEINNLYNPHNGYELWVNFLLKLKQENVFQEIVPTLIINPDDEYYDYNLKTQFINLQKHFKKIIYRNTIIDEYGYDDLDLLKENIGDTDFSILIDCGYTPNATRHNVANKTISRINNFNELFIEKKVNYTVVSTSFPNNVSEMGGEDYDLYQITSVLLYDDIKSKIFSNVTYGDYGSINPIRNDQVIMARGWIPRIDTPLLTQVYYYRARRPKGISAYAETYKKVATMVISDSQFPSNLNLNWGINQIQNCHLGLKPGATPSFWISVRMNIHLEQQVRRIFDLD